MDSGQLMELGTLAKETAGLSLQRTWRAIERERSSAWNAIIGTIAGEWVGSVTVSYVSDECM